MKKFLLLIALLALTGLQATAQETRLRYATFNIRYDNPDDGQNRWKKRKDKVCRFIAEREIDVVGMQEVLHGQAKDLKRGLKGYAMVGVGRDDGKTKGEYAPIFYRTDRFEVMASHTFWLSQYPDSAGFIGWDGACTRIATWAKLRECKTERVFMAVNTHFDHVGTEARRKGALLIIDSIRHIVGDKPAVVTGDFNVDDRSEAYRTLTTNRYVLRDAHKIAKETTGVNYTFHDFGRLKPEELEKIDFIFVSEGIKVLRSDIPAPPDGPTGYLSDHNPQIAELEF